MTWYSIRVRTPRRTVLAYLSGESERDALDRLCAWTGLAQYRSSETVRIRSMEAPSKVDHAETRIT